MPRSFVDTNVLVYAADPAEPTPRRTIIARDLLLRPGLVLSVQVLNEWSVNATHPAKLHLDEATEKAWLSRWLLFPIQPLDLDTFLRARGLQRRFGFSLWDCLVAAAALEAGCDTLYTEDLQHGQSIDGLRIIDPFRAPATRHAR